MRIAIIGRTEILYDTAERLRAAGHTISCILTAKEAPEYARTADDFRALAERWGVPFSKGGRITEKVDFLEQAASDIAVSINYSGVIPKSIIDLFPLGVLNAHGGDLPRYRGNACQAWAILNGEDRIGLCVHKMIGGELDSGDIISRDYFPIDHTTKVTAVLQWIFQRTPDLMLDAVVKLGANPEFYLERQSKKPEDALRCYPRKPEDGRIDWSRSAIHILRQINATNKPFEGAFCDYEGKKLIIWDAELANDKEFFFAVPGQVTRIGANFIEVACGADKLRLHQIEHDGRVVAPNEVITSTRARFT
jgi:methionyl-tRNA formyltransferase